MFISAFVFPSFFQACICMCMCIYHPNSIHMIMFLLQCMRTPIAHSLQSPFSSQPTPFTLFSVHPDFFIQLYHLSFVYDVLCVYVYGIRHCRYLFSLLFKVMSVHPFWLSSSLLSYQPHC
ncbi:hypothetical protein EON63_17010 [archaeon]|nr:MAG: hypothetical protein EON63_17010 [archaeon]